MGGGGSGALLLGRHRGVGLTARPIEAAAARAFVGAPSAVLAWVGKGGARAQLLAAGATSLVAALGSGDYSL